MFFREDENFKRLDQQNKFLQRRMNVKNYFYVKIFRQQRRNDGVENGLYALSPSSIKLVPYKYLVECSSNIAFYSYMRCLDVQMMSETFQPQEHTVTQLTHIWTP